MTTTKRRNSKITAAERLAKTSMPYTQVHLSHVDEEAQIVRCTATKDIEINGHNGAKVRLSAGEEFFLARSDSVENGWYIIASGRCSCPALKPCKHEKALQAKLDAEHAETADEETVELLSVKYACNHNEMLFIFKSEVAEMAPLPCHDCRAAELSDEFIKERAEAEKVFGANVVPATSKRIAASADVRGDLYSPVFSLYR